MKTTYLKHLLKLLVFSFVLTTGMAQEYNSFDIRYQNNIKGDLTFIGNNIVNRDGGTATTTPEDAYNNLSTDSNSDPETEGFFNYNDFKNMQYIDVDDDPTTFSSSSSTFTFPQASCNLIRYAGLYWSATYPSETANGFYDGVTYSPNTITPGTGRQTDFNQVRFRVPGGTYVDVTADEVLFDGFTSTDPDVQRNSPYACYADVTSLVTALANPEGEYTVANVRSVTGSLTPGGGAAGGWTLVIVYENPNLTGKLITTFDGFAWVNGTNSIDINYNGFNTIPAGPVNADIGVASLEGDFRIPGDGMSISAASSATFTDISNATNPVDNFFNSNLTLDGVVTTNRNPASANTLGYDTDMFLLSNPANSVIPNAETDATFRFSTDGDSYYPFFNSFNVEIIEPNIVLEKRVEDIAGNDITGAGVNLGQTLDYVLSFVNTGNDDATNYTIRDILPVNVTLDELTMTLPAGVTYVYDSLNREITFSIPDGLVEVGDPASNIRMRVQVAQNCFDFIDACSNQIENLAYSTYEGIINDNEITDDPSVSDFDNCGFVTPGATNFLLDDLANCDFSRTVELCGANVLLDAGDNFDTYTWYLDSNGNSIIDAGDVVVTDGDSDNDPSTFLVTQAGTYIVDKDVADPCLGFQEIIHVTLFGTTQVNPISTLINDTSNTVDGEVVVCPNDGQELPEIFLCGLNDTELIQINIPDADSIEWEQLDETSCGAATPDCANTDGSCTWNNVANGNDFLAQDAGQYRLVVNYQNGCFSRFYFNIYKNPLDPQYTFEDIMCGNQGNITVTNVPLNYEFQLLDDTTNNVLVGYNSNPSFDIAANGIYAVEIRQQGVSDGCVFRLDNIGIRERNFQVDVSSVDTNCNGLGSISISVLDVEPQYYYEILLGATSVDTFGPTIDNNHTFNNLNDGTYEVRASTDDGCAFTQNVTINDVTDLAVSALVTKSIDCTNGTVELTASGGFPNPDYFFAIWSHDGVDLYPDVASIPGGAYQIGTTYSFTAAEAGDYEFIVVDGYNCSFISNEITITEQPSIDYTTSLTNETCFNQQDGTYTVNVINSNGYSLSYVLTYPDSSTQSNTSGQFTGLGSGGYVLTVTQTQGAISCDFVETFSIGGPTAPLSSSAVFLQDYTCTQFGIIEAQNTTGGTPPYEYSIDGVNFDGSFGAEQFGGLVDGTYTITVRDANGCTVQTNPITIDPFVQPSDLTFTSTAVVCPANSSDVTVTVVDGEGPFLFEITAPSNIAATSITGGSANFDGLSPDTYIFQVTDANGCTYDESFTINPVTPIDVVGTLDANLTCLNDGTGAISFDILNFSTNYDYTVTGPQNFTGNAEVSANLSFTGLDAGTYTIQVTDNATNCTDSVAVTVNGPASQLVIAANETQPTCTVPGSVVVSASGGWGRYNYVLTNPDATTVGPTFNGTFTGLTQTGTFTATATDANGCSVSTTFTLTNPTSPNLTIAPNDFCYDDAIGLTLTATVTTGGDGNFEYSLNGGAFVPTNSFSGLTTGTYTIEVRDGNNCTDTETITINPELTLVASAPNITTCGSSIDINITPAGGDGNYVFAVVGDGVIPTGGDFSATNPITVNATGDYDVYVRDANGAAGFCEASFDITINQDSPLGITPSISDVSCFGGNDGSISIVASGGEAPYQYSTDNGANFQVSSSFNNLVAGSYDLVIRDANGCTETATVNVLQAPQLVAEAALTQNYTCIQNGEITVGSVTPTSGGSGSYQYQINSGGWSASTAGGFSFTGLTNGTYTVEVRDANVPSCTLTLPVITIDALPNPPTPTFNVTYNCDGSGNIEVLPNDPAYEYAINSGAFQSSNLFNNIAVGTHSITIDYGRDCTISGNVTVAPGNAFAANLTGFSNVSCNTGTDGSITFEVENFDTINGYEYSVNGGAFSNSPTGPVPNTITISSLSANSYTIEVRDVNDNSCSVTLNQTISEPTPVLASGSLTDVLTCSNGGATITASASGGTPNYNYQLEDGVGGIIAGYDFATNGANTVFTGLAAGDYIVRARDTNNCEDIIDSAITVDPTNGITFNTTITNCYSGANDATIQVDVTDGNGDYEFSIDGGPFVAPTPSTATTYTFQNLTDGTYTIDVRDGFGCVAAQQTVTINPELQATAVLVNDLTCLADASITINASGGVTTYSYEWSNNGGATFQNTNFTGNTFTTNTFGTYIFRVTDSASPANCTVLTNQVIVTEAQTPVISAITPTDVLCNGDLTGILDITIDTSVGLAPYVINVTETISSTNYGTQTTGLPAGNYSVTITDAKGCVSAPFGVSIAEPTPIAQNTSSTNLVCTVSGTELGTITIDASGGTPTYIYTVHNADLSYNQNYDTSSGTNDHIFTGLDFGDYTVIVRDSNNCETTSTITITTGPDILITTQGTAGCTPGSGEMDVTADTTSGTLGAGPFYFAIFPAPPFNALDPAWNAATTTVAPAITPNSYTFTGLTPGVTYTFIVHDVSSGCDYNQEATVPVAATSTMASTIDTVENVTCTGAADGSVDFTVSGHGGSDVNYELFQFVTNTTTGITGTISGVVGGPESETISALAPGEYYLLLEEANGPNTGCVIASASFTITQSPNLLQVTADSPQNDNCNPNQGLITAVAQFGTAPYEYQYLLNTDPPPTAAGAGWLTATSMNVESGNYIVYVKDANDCIQSDAVTVLLDADPQISLSVVDECVAEGSFEVLVTLDNPLLAVSPFSLSLNGGASQNIAFNGSNQYTVTGISSGLGQTITVTDFNGCSDSQNFDIHPPLQFTAVMTTALDCEVAPANNAEITIDVLAGSGSYDYEIDGPGAVDQARIAMGGSSVVWTNASVAGSYTVTVYDTSTSVPNCLGAIIVDVPNAVVPDFTETHIDITCNGANDGSIILFETANGITPLSYAISPVAGTFNAATNTFENLPAGNYTVTATGSNSCTTSISGIIIDEPLVITVPAPSPVAFGCTVGNNPDNPTVTVDTPSITGGSGNYVLFEFIDTATTGVLQSGTSNSYIETSTGGRSITINVYDDNGCVGTVLTTIPAFNELQSTSIAVDTPISCSNTGEEMTITAVGSLNNSSTDPADYEFRLLPSGTFQASGSFTSLGAGTHNFEVRNVNTGCVITASHTVADPNTFTIDVNVLNDIICFGTQTGQVTFELIDGTYSGPIAYEIFDTNGTPTNLADDISVVTGTFATNGPTTPELLFAGNYYVEITQTAFPECSNIEAFSIASPSAAITGDVSVTDITCLGNDGEIEIIDVLGGWGGYSYYVGTSAPAGTGSYTASPVFTGLSAGTYEAWVMDLEGCPQQVRTGIVLADPTAITASLQINNDNCTNVEGEIEVVGVLGGQGSNYTYQLIQNSVNIGSPQTSPVFSNLGDGIYEVLVADQWSCTFTTPQVELHDEMNLTTTIIKPIDCSATPDGEITVTVNGGSGNFDYTVTFPDAITTLNNTTGVFAGLSQVGTYTFVVIDLDTASPVCSRTISENLVAPTPVTFDPHTLVNISCNGGADGSIAVNLQPTSAGVNDDPVYTYNLYDNAGALVAGPQTDPNFSGLAAGVYEVEAISSKSCVAREFVTLSEPLALAVSASATPFTCNAQNTTGTSIITATASDGTPGYLYSIDGTNYQSDNTFEVINDGTVQNITLFARDNNGCEQSDTVTLQPINSFTALVTQNIAISCINPEEVLITVTDDGNLANNYTFELLPIGNAAGAFVSSPTNTTATFNLNIEGTYTFRITDTNTGCYIDTSPYTIAPFDLVDVTAVPTAPAICFGDSNGALEITLSGYSGTYDYEIFDDSNVSTGITGSANTTTNPLAISGLSGGNYVVRVTQTAYPFCTEDSNTITISSPDRALTLIPAEVANVTCTNDQGEIDVSPDGGYAPFDIILTNTTTSDVYTQNDVVSFVFTGLSAGDYTVQVTDDSGCTITENLTLVEPSPITAGITATPTTLQCYGDTNAAVSATSVIGGEGVYQYLLNSYDSTGTVLIASSGLQGSPDFSNLGAGVYSITISDGWSCGLETAQVTISEPTEVQASLVQLSQLTCTAQAQLELSVVGGTGPYEFSSDGTTYNPINGATTHVFSTGAGTYQFFVRDSFGCESMISNEIVIDPVDPLMLIIDESAAIINCTGENSASLFVEATGGLGNYNYELFSDAALTNLIAGPTANDEFSALGSGSYYIRVTSGDCVEVSNEIIITDPQPLQIVTQESTDVSCNGEQDGTISVEVTGGTGEIFYAITPNLDLFDTENTFTDLGPGLYDVIAQDRNGCFIPFQFTIVEPSLVDVTVSNSTDETCFGNNDGTFDLSITGGTGPYFTALDSNSDVDFVQDQTSFSDITPGLHVVFVRDSQGCESNVTIEIEAGVNLNATVAPIYICTGNIPENSLDIVFEDTTVISDVMFALDSTDPADMQLDFDFSNLAPGDHFITIAHANGCINTIDFQIENYEPLTLQLEQININEITALITGGVEEYTIYFGDVDNGSDNTYIINRTDTYLVSVVDQNGCEVSAEIFIEFIDVELPEFFSPDGDGFNDTWSPRNLEPYPNALTIIYDRYGRELYRMVSSDSPPWSGFYQGSTLPTGDYWYILKLQGESDDREFIGHFTLYR